MHHRHRDITAPQRYAFGDCVLDCAARELRFAGQSRHVPRLVFDLLRYLIEHRDRVVPKGELMEQLWQGSEASDNLLARAMMKARDVVGDAGGTSRVIKTVHRVGYRFIAPLTETGPALPEPLPPGWQTLLTPDQPTGKPLRSLDPFAHEAYVRARQAALQGRPVQALRLLQVVLDLEPDNPALNAFSDALRQRASGGEAASPVDPRSTRPPPASLE